MNRVSQRTLDAIAWLGSIAAVALLAWVYLRAHARA